MKNYKEILADLNAKKDEKFRVFSERIMNIQPDSSVGVKIPLLRAYARGEVKDETFDLEELFSFPDDVFEIKLLKCLCIGYIKMPFVKRVEWIRRAVQMIDGWAVCDLFCSTLKEVKKHRAEFLSEIERYVEEGKEYTQRFGYVMLLGCYMEPEYLPVIFSLLSKAETKYYYTHMGAAWLIAEVLVKFYEEGVEYLKTCPLDKKTYNKAIQKARESFRLTEEQKNLLKSMKKQ